MFLIKRKKQALDERISKTKANKTQLLPVLKYPEIPLHNNDAKLGVCAQVRKQNVSLHTMIKDGTKANNTFITSYSAGIESVKQLLSVANPLLLFRHVI